MNIDSPIFVPRNNAPMTSMPAAQLKVSAASLLDPKTPKSPLALGVVTPNAFGKLTDSNNIKHKNNNMGGYWPFVNNAAAYYPCGINSNYLQFCQQQQQQQQQYMQHFVQRQRTLPNFHNQWTQRKNLNAAIGQRQQQQQQRKQTTKATAPAAISTEVSAQQHQQRRKKQKMQQQAAQQHKQQQLTELQQQPQAVNITKIPIANKTSDSLSPKLTVATTTTNANQNMLLLLPAAEELININVVNDNNLNSNNIVIDQNAISNNNNNNKVDEDINMATLAAISNGTSALPNQSTQLVEEAEISTKQDDTVQRNGSRVGQQIRNPRYYQQQQQQQNSSNTQLNAKTDSSDSGISTNGRHQQHHHHHAHRQQPQQHNQKQRKTRLNSKRQDNNTTTMTTTPKRTTEYTVDDWLGREMVYCYGHRYISSCAEDNLLAARHNPAHRNSTSSDAAASDDLNSSSSNEDLSAVYAVMSQPDKKTGNKARRNRQQRRRKRLDEQSADQLQAIPMDVDEDSKENRRPAPQHAHQQQQQQQQQQQSTAKAASVNLRKQCTKAAALKAVNKHNSGNNSSNSNAKPNSGAHALANSASNSSVCSALSSASSTYSLSSSASSTSSAASSPTNSANCSPTASPTASKRNAENFRKIARALAPPLRQHTKLNMSEHELVQQLRRYIIDPNLLRVYGYPVESAIHEGCIEIYKCLPRPSGVHTHHSTTKTDVVNTVDGLQVHYTSNSSSSTTTNTGFKAQWTLGGDNSTDSGQGSGDSSPPSMDSDSSEAGEDEPATTTACFTPDGSYQIFSQYDQSLEKQCVRCMRTFHVTETGEYLSYESCTFHWGKLYNLYTGSKGYTTQYTCCAGTKDTEGCSRNPLHVWTGAVVGINGPYSDFVHTRARCDDKPTKVYALDCEMSFTGRGLEVTKVTVVGHDGQLVYEHFVRPEVEIVDYNTRFSGITEKDLCAHSNKNVKTLAEVQRDLLQLIDAETILIGHGLDNDLRVLRIVHKTIIDTSIAFPHSSGFPYRRALKNLTKACLNRDIQCSDAGHSSFEDSRACLELMLWKVRKEMRPTAY
ncbi:protein kinase 4-like isoform X1 [Bactrocera tryoni]|uniref:protein kinase 4-like isoform X1 n=1 Tax=Bactrocera tryoni TaxID=59916 RepID=UPI001A9886FC|nr:protein kinase 4-like isoform X1 [Bactrocera tryoni]XP_039962740.1 protein kinase 4-like isoform X1 [Bactrocera tryoni]